MRYGRGAVRRGDGARSGREDSGNEGRCGLESVGFGRRWVMGWGGGCHNLHA